jgi:hypothetical protein
MGKFENSREIPVRRNQPRLLSGSGGCERVCRCVSTSVASSAVARACLIRTSALRHWERSKARACGAAPGYIDPWLCSSLLQVGGEESEECGSGGAEHWSRRNDSALSWADGPDDGHRKEQCLRRELGWKGGRT